MGRALTLRILASLFVIGAAGAACAELPPIAENQCGNRIVDATEDCDTFAPSGSSCIAPGNENECRLDCSGANACPSTYTCGPVDKICRRPTGKYDVANVTTLFAEAAVMSLGDFDGDGRADALTSGLNDVRLHYFDARLSLSKTFILPISGPKFRVGAMGNDTNEDLEIFRTTGLVDVFRGQSDRTLAPVIYSSVPIPNTNVTARTFLARNDLANVTGDPLARPTGDDIFAFGSGAKGGFVIDLAGRAFASSATAPANQIVAAPDSTVDKLAGPIAVGAYIEGSVCDQFAIGFSGADNVAVYTPCRTSTNPPTTPYAYEINAIDAHYVPATRVQLPGGATFGATANGVTAGAFSIDANEDGHLDLVIVGTAAVGTQIYIAYGIGNGTFSSSPTLTPVDNLASHFAAADSILTAVAVTQKKTAIPLAVGDLNHDKTIDLVFPGNIFISDSTQPTADGGAFASPHYIAGPSATNATWSSAVIADLNHDGIEDIAATNPTGSIDYFMGTGTQAMSYLSYGLDGTPANLVVGDFDGDLVNDLAYALSGVSGLDAGAAASNEIQAMFGQSGAFPAQPTTLGTTPSVLQLTAAPLAAAYTGVTAPTNVNVSSMVALSLDSSSNVFAAILAGNPDRLLTSSFALFASTTQRAAGVRGITGAFTTAGQADMIMIARNVDATSSHSFWYLPSTGPAAIDSTKLVVGPALPTNIDWETALPIPGAISSTGILQAIVIGPPPAGTTAPPQIFTIDSKALTLGAAISLPCNFQNVAGAAGVQNRAVDLDGDGVRDLIFSCPDVSGKSVVVVYWGDANGNFDASRMTLVPTPADPLTSFTQVRGGAFVQRTVMMLTANAVFSATPGGSDGRTFSPPIQDPTLPGGSFINSADMDGDGVLDIGIVDLTKTQVQFFRGIPIDDSPSVP